MRLEGSLVRPGWGSTLSRHAWLGVFLVAASLPPLLLGKSYLMSVFVSVALYGIVVVSLDLLLGYGGLLSAGHNGFFALGAYVMGVLAARLGVPLLAGMVAAVLVNLALAFVIGTATLRMKEFYFAVATLGFGVIVVQIIAGLVDYTGGWSGLTGVPKLSLFGFTVTSDLEFYVIAVAGLLASLALGQNLVDSRFGRAIRAFGNDELAAEMLGIHVPRHRIQLFMVSSVFASVAGSIYGLFLRVVTPANFDTTAMIEMVLMLFLGGKATLWGGVVGASIVLMMPEVMGAFQDFKTLVQGLGFILILILLPGGLAGAAQQMWQRLRQRVAARSPVTAQRPDVAHRHLLDALDGSDSGLSVRRPDAPMERLLEVSHLTKLFRGLRAVSDLSFRVRPGQLKAIIGPNGAGKTTVFNLVTGVIPPDGGEVVFNSTNISSARPYEVVWSGIARTFQTPRLFASMTVLENVMVGHHSRLRSGLTGALFPRAQNRVEERRMLDSSWALLDLVGLGRRADLLADKLPFGERRLLEIARALALQPRLLLLDEPAAGLNEAEKDRLGELLLRLRDGGITLLLVEHNMRLVMRIADEVLVMNHGEKISEGTAAEVQRDAGVLRAYLGENSIHAAS